MTQSPLVSVALCTFNGAEFLAEQLDTLVGQTYRPIEIIVVDDCSTDETFAILEAYAAKNPQFKLYRNESNLGFTANFERAATYCTGELIALCDQDDLWAPQKIELQVAAIKDNIFIYHDSEFIHEDGTSMNKKMSDLMNLYHGDNPLAFLFFNCVSGHSILMKKSLIELTLPLKKGYFHDWWLAYVATNIGTIDFIPQCLVKYRQHDKSETNILQLAREKDKYKMSSAENFQRTLNWLYYCKSFQHNKNQSLIDQFYRAYKRRSDSFISFEFSALLLRHWKAIFFMRKKTVISKMNYVIKQIWGLKMKKNAN
ncbi:MAG TPA: glycosyltransferase family 2 protein [Mucilaginibacter sp.]|jgi:glycosyltransferase involved in cell wall biosynthesis|nr:glycosyltransferase family 2 protein [Mucilaginibacter sp.]